MVENLQCYTAEFNMIILLGIRFCIIIEICDKYIFKVGFFSLVHNIFAKVIGLCDTVQCKHALLDTRNIFCVLYISNLSIYHVA